MVIKFPAGSFRDIMKVCGTVAASSQSSQAATRYIDLFFPGVSDCTCTAYGCNGHQISRLTVTVSYDDLPYDYHLLVPPLKTPPHTQTVEIHIDEDEKKYNVIFVDGEDEEIDAMTNPFCDLEPIDYKSFWSKGERRLDDVSSDGRGRYCIAVNPKHLISALEGMKSCDSVVFNFANPTDAFFIRPYVYGRAPETDPAAYILPVRMA